VQCIDLTAAKPARDAYPFQPRSAMGGEPTIRYCLQMTH
jgi:hypothetical protein